MPRRRKRNPLLMRIMVFTAIFHVIAIPIAAHFGAFDKLRRQFGEARVVLLPPPPQEKEKQQAKEKKAKPKVDKSKSATRVVKRGGPVKANPNLHKVEASNAPAGEGEATIQQGTQTSTGEVPTAPTKTTVASTQPPTTTTTVTPPTPPVKPPATTPPVSTPPTVTTPVTKHIPVYVEPEQDYSPQPTIPDDLRNDSLSKDFVAMVTVSSDGTIKDLKVTQSTGIKELDDVATSTLKTWRFKPATLDGSGTDGAVKLTIQFRVE